MLMRAGRGGRVGVRGGIVLLASALIGAAACSSTSTTAGGGSQKTVTFAGFFGVFQDQFTEAVIEPFEKQHPDIKVNFVPIKNSAEVLGKLRATKSRPDLDVALMDSSVAPTANTEGLFAQLDPAKVGNLANVDKAGRNGNWGPALTFDSLSILYNTKQVKTPPTSWNDLWDGAYKGKIALPIADTRGVALIVALEKIAGANYQQSIDPALNRLKQLAPNVQTWNPQPDVYTAIASGADSIGVGWNARGQIFNRTSKGALATVQPKEGNVLQVNTINLVKNSPRADAAQQFIDYAISAPAQEAFAKASYYAPTNTKATLPGDVLELTAQSKQQQANRIPIDWAWITPRYSAWVDRIKREVISE
ncbi:ABC transporter substrate-binding protein [Actinomadura vinacea]|uniref:ABC transporter substrate-binding protein n=1 Tax=Actinomadura vinacea TaxID=115336 RepID=A0ABN3KB29_9ACTN